ncbi:MarR family transcriptional regulator [Clostridium swellfunianum]|uniref:MarR family winged helix-turn-helix transcriptional regulator n=1 Tax=Clostridium swellfunianum TaxID=1367462 RepID=UPI00202DC2B6|nr:MarR family transcriptional regulator [Clostridium swellfunianum]MCM0646999.1 MarR family transcriptional regulator [Clostridium swellfunianum]
MSKAIMIVQIMKEVMANIKNRIGNHFKELNLTRPQGMLLGTLAHQGEMKVSELSESLGLSNSTVSGILDRLENQGLVERIRSKEDRRVVYVKITEEFRKHSQKHFDEVNKLIEEMMNKATQEELDIIFKGMDMLRQVVKRQE